LLSDCRAGLWDLDAADARQRAACLLACSPHHPTPCALRGRRARIIRRLGRQAIGDACPQRGVLRNQSVDPPISATINASFSGESVSGKTVIAKFDDGLLSSDGGTLLLREVEQRFRVADRLAACMVDPRAPELITTRSPGVLRAENTPSRQNSSDGDRSRAILKWVKAAPSADKFYHSEIKGKRHWLSRRLRSIAC
jgi:hypothetical protein